MEQQQQQAEKTVKTTEKQEADVDTKITLGQYLFKVLEDLKAIQQETNAIKKNYLLMQLEMQKLNNKIDKLETFILTNSNKQSIKILNNALSEEAKQRNFWRTTT